MRKKLAIAAFSAYMLVLLDLTLVFRPPARPAPGVLLQRRPFASIGYYFRLGGHELPFNVAGNLAVFAPFGLLLPAIWRRMASPARVVAAGVGASLAIEALQYAGGWRVADVDDIILNAGGTLIGYAGFVAIRSRPRISPKPGQGPMFHAASLTIETKGRGTAEITGQVDRVVRDSGAFRGVCTVFVHHTSASLIITENADPEVRRDLERAFARLAPDGDPLFRHDAEGPDDMPAHVRSILTQTSLSIPIADGRCDLGTWQGVFLWEHRAAAHRRRVTVSVVGEG